MPSDLSKFTHIKGRVGASAPGPGLCPPRVSPSPSAVLMDQLDEHQGQSLPWLVFILERRKTSLLLALPSRLLHTSSL